eukprot:10962171-Alexandrium_andersonii.AAC.1
MSCWDAVPETRGASQPAFTVSSHGAPQPMGQGTAMCLAVRVSSFNFGMPQGTLTSERKWRGKH